MLAWMACAASAGLIYANTIVAIYNLYHPGFEPQRYQIFIAYLGVVWLTSAVVAFGQSQLHHITTFTVFACLGGWIICLLMLAIMPSRNGFGYASNSFVWSDWQNLTGWSSNGLVFLAGTLNGAWTIGVVDVATHLAEEVPNPRRNIPRATFVYLFVDTISAFVFYVALVSSSEEWTRLQANASQALRYHRPIRRPELVHHIAAARCYVPTGCTHNKWNHGSVDAVSHRRAILYLRRDLNRHPYPMDTRS